MLRQSTIADINGEQVLDRRPSREPQIADAEAIALVAKALAHPGRMKIIAFLLSRPGFIGGDIVDEVGLAQSTVSEHLRILKASGLVVEQSSPRASAIRLTPPFWRRCGA